MDGGSELKACPFCGSERHTIETSGIIGQPGLPTYTVFCDGCHASSATELTEAEAIERWNTRAKSETPTPGLTDDVVKELVEALPSGWPFWLDDAASILRSNGTTGHADKVRDVLIALTDALSKPALELP